LGFPRVNRPPICPVIALLKSPVLGGVNHRRVNRRPIRDVIASLSPSATTIHIPVIRASPPQQPQPSVTYLQTHKLLHRACPPHSHNQQAASTPHAFTGECPGAMMGAGMAPSAAPAQLDTSTSSSHDGDVAVVKKRTRRSSVAQLWRSILPSGRVQAGGYGQGLTLVHFSAQLERYSWLRGCA